MASFSVSTYLKTQFSLHLRLSWKDLAFNLCSYVKANFDFLYQRNCFLGPWATGAVVWDAAAESGT